MLIYIHNKRLRRTVEDGAIPLCNSVNKSKVKLATVVEGDQKALFSIATTPRCMGGRYSFPWYSVNTSPGFKIFLHSWANPFK